MHDLACLLIPQEIFTLKGHRGPQSPGITDTRLLRLFLVKSISCAIFAQIYEISGLGREGHIYIDSPTVSKRHAEIKITNGKIYRRDLDSTNGTFLNRKKSWF
jgi:hypothetical protein